MRNIIILLLCYNILSLPAYCTITDSLVDNNLDKNIKIKERVNINIQDDLVDKSLDKNLKIKSKEQSVIIDTFAENNKNKNPQIVKQGEIIEIVPVISKDTQRYNKKVIIDTNSAKAITVQIKQRFSTKQAVEEGDYVEFITKNDAVINNKMFPAGSVVKARIENISLNKCWGVPSDLIIGNFTLNQIPLQGEITKTGANRSMWVYPCVYCLSFFFGAGLLFIPIRGGHAIINPTESFTLYAD